MTFKEWRAWFKEIPVTVKWFVILILLRPIIDNFYWIKEINPLYSPLNIVGVLTPVLILWSLSSRSLPARIKGRSGSLFLVYGVIVFFNIIFLDLRFLKLEFIGLSIKCITPVLLFIYLRRVIRSQRELNGILTTFLYSGIYLLLMIGYESFVNPIKYAYLTEGRGGGTRLTGVYNDMMNYAIYIVGTLLIAGYFFLKNVYRVNKAPNYVLKFWGFLTIVILGLLGIKHVSSWGVCILLFSLIVFFNLKNLKGFAVVFFVIAIISPFFADTIYTKQIEPLINKEMNVMEGDAELSSALNGRVGRWEKYFDVWSSEMSVFNRLFGIGTSGHIRSAVMVSPGMHSDFIRNLFLAGIIGLAFYFIFLLQVLIRVLHFRIPEKFLIAGSILALMLHSVSTVPLIYSSYMYLLLSVISFACLPTHRAYSVTSWNSYARMIRRPHIRPDAETSLRKTG